MSGALDRELWITTFPDRTGTSRHSEFVTLRALAERLRDTTAPTKDQLPLIKLASFGDRRSSRLSLRTDKNLFQVYGVEIDYDGEQIAPEQFADALRTAGLAAVVVTSPSHRDDAPRHRAYLPFSALLKPDQRGAMVSRVAGILPAELAPESWTASQAFYAGRVGDAPEHRVILVEGDYLDLRPDLDATAKAKPPPATKPKRPARKPRRQLTLPLEEPDGDAPEPLDTAAALAALRYGGGAHNALVSLAGQFAASGVPQQMTLALLAHEVEQRPPEGRDDGWQRLRDDVARTIAWAYEKEAESATHHAAVLASARAHSGNGTAPPPPPPPPGASGTGPTPGPAPQPAASATLPLLRNRPPRFAGSIENVMTVLRQDPQFAGCFTFDAMALSIVVRQPLPWSALPFTPHRLADDDISRLQGWLQRIAQMGRVGWDTAWRGVDCVARETAFHPIRDWLGGLAWDGTPRLDTWLSDYAGSVDTPYVRAIGRMFLISMVARVQRPGCKADYTLILEGPQGILKSQLLRELAQPWFSDQLPDPHSKDASQHLRGRWLIELGELDAMLRTEVTALNAFLTRAVEVYRPSYGRSTVHEPRQSVFAGTTNLRSYLRDPTGGRRFWCAIAGETGAIDPLRLRRDRDQLFAEALAAFHAGEHWWPTPAFERDHMRPEQERRYHGDSWEDEIARELPRLRAPNTAGTHWEVTVLQLAIQALQLEVARIAPRDQQRIAHILQRLGWSPRVSHGRRWWEMAVSP
jgi:predicted P-loop ATPase